jgi:hypothetical protein
MSTNFVNRLDGRILAPTCWAISNIISTSAFQTKDLLKIVKQKNEFDSEALPTSKIYLAGAPILGNLDIEGAMFPNRVREYWTGNEKSSTELFSSA